MKTILVLSPHTDDGELGAGGTIARFVEEGHAIWCVAFSTADNPQLEIEFRAACVALGVMDRAIIHDFPRRNFPQYRQAILQHLIGLRDRIKPDLVLTPSPHDIHQDHQVVTAEALRAFKQVSVLGYELPWNNLVFETRHFVLLEKYHIEAKVGALKCYKSQKHRTYLDESLIWAMAKLRGTQVEAKFAEAFEVLRWIT
jgi:LmbE family N-acetylglucosaminyl deacetylase